MGAASLRRSTRIHSLRWSWTRSSSYMPPKAMVRAIKAREKADREWLRDLADMEADD